MANALTTTESFAQTTSLLMQAEIAATAVAARAKAQIEARYIMALRSPRNWDQVRQDVLKECNRTSFAENKSVWYRKPVGKGVEGLGIRFVEMALRCMRNIDTKVTLVFEDAAKEIYEVCMTDLEANLNYDMQVIVHKTVERSKPMDDGFYVAVRKNSDGKNVYTVPARDEEILDKRGALISKAIRTVGLKHIPGDLKDEAEAAIKQTRLNSVKQDPDSHRKKIVDSFARLNVRAMHITEFLGHSIELCSPAQLDELRQMYEAIQAGDAIWKDFMDKKREDAGEEPKADPLAAAAAAKKAPPVTIDGTTGNVDQKAPPASAARSTRPAAATSRPAPAQQQPAKAAPEPKPEPAPAASVDATGQTSFLPAEDNDEAQQGPELLTENDILELKFSLDELHIPHKDFLSNWGLESFEGIYRAGLDGIHSDLDKKKKAALALAKQKQEVADKLAAQKQ